MNVVGFLTKFSPAHHPKDFVLATLKTRLNKQTMPHFKIKQTSILSEINNRKIRIQVYAIEVQNKDTRQAEKQLMKHEEDPVEFVSFRMRKINIEAYQTAIALVAQHQHDLRTIVINNISEEAFFVLEGEAKQLERVVTVHHLKEKKSMRILTYEEDFVELRHKIKKSMPTWISKLDPSDIRTCGNNPEVAYTKYDEYSDDTLSDMSYSINSLLTIDINDMDLFSTTINNNQEQKEGDEKQSKTFDERINQQQRIIETQDKKIEELLTMMKDMKDSTERKIDNMLILIEKLTTKTLSKERVDNIKVKEKEENRRP